MRRFGFTNLPSAKPRQPRQPQRTMRYGFTDIPNPRPKPRPSPSKSRPQLAPPPPPPDPAPQGPPIDPFYNDELANNQNVYNNTIGNIGYARTRTMQEYGFDDVSNPYNRAAMMRRAYQQGQRGTTNSMAAGGQLYSGALQRGLDEGTFQYDRSYNDLRREYDDRLQGFTELENQAKFDYDQGVIGANADMYERALDWDPAPAAAPAPSPKPPAQSLGREPGSGPQRGGNFTFTRPKKNKKKKGK